MSDAGILDVDRGDFELLDGEIFYMPPPGPSHAEVVDRLTSLFVEQVGALVRVRVQNPVRLGDHSQPEPDLSLLARKSYRAAHPGPEDVVLLVEVADSSLKKDRELKIPLYAQAGIREVWLVDLEFASVHIHRQPRGRAYRKCVTLHRPTDELTSPALADLHINLGELLA